MSYLRFPFLSIQGDPLMFARHWQAALLAMVVVCGLAGCTGNGNYKHSDKDYRPLGEPQAVNRGQ